MPDLTPFVLGADPGRQSGAAVLLEGRALVSAWWTWCLLPRKGGDVYRVTSGWVDLPATVEVDSMWRVGEVISHGCPPDLEVVVEGLFVPRPRRGQRAVNPQSVIPLAEAAGELIGGLRRTPLARPLATEWRWAQLSLPHRTTAAGAEKAAMRLARHAFAWPKVKGPPTEAERGALAEAAFIARHGWDKANGIG